MPAVRRRWPKTTVGAYRSPDRWSSASAAISRSELASPMSSPAVSLRACRSRCFRCRRPSAGSETSATPCVRLMCRETGRLPSRKGRSVTTRARSQPRWSGARRAASISSVVGAGGRASRSTTNSVYQPRAPYALQVPGQVVGDPGRRLLRQAGRGEHAQPDASCQLAHAECVAPASSLISPQRRARISPCRIAVFGARRKRVLSCPSGTWAKGRGSSSFSKYAASFCSGLGRSARGRSRTGFRAAYAIFRRALSAWRRLRPTRILSDRPSSRTTT